MCTHTHSTSTSASTSTSKHTRQARRHEITPIAVHLTFQNCDQSGKRHRIREALLWDTDPPQHYAPPGGLISFELDLPDSLTSGFAPKESADS